MLHGEKVSTSFSQKVAVIAAEIGIDPNWLMQCMAFETAGTFSPSIKTPNGSATGLIQFLESTAKGLGTSTAELAKMDAVTQLDYVRAYFMPYKGKLHSLTDVYLTIFYPAAIKWDLDKIFPKSVAAANPAFRNDAGNVTKRKIEQVVGGFRVIK